MRIISGLSDGQVLQRGADNKGWAVVAGVCEGPGKGEVLVTVLSGKAAVAGWKNKPAGRVRGGQFSVKVGPLPVGGPYKVSLHVLGETLVVADVFVGDVWLLAGQSNMEGVGLLSESPKPHPKVQALYMDGRWRRAADPLHFMMESIDEVHCTSRPSQETIDRARGAAVQGACSGLPFALEMLRISRGVPQGLIATAHGGTSMTQWSPARRDEGGKSLYGSMYRAWKSTGQKVRGVLWYQGESDTSDADVPLYTQRMKDFVKAVRRDLRQPRLPFLMVQIGKMFGDSPSANWNAIQMQETLLPKLIPNLECVPAIDLPMVDFIHVGTRGQIELGRRLAMMADRLAYGNKRQAGSPRLAGVRLVRQSRGRKTVQIEVAFANVVGALTSKGLPTGFAVLNDKGQDTRSIYDIKLQGNKALLLMHGWLFMNASQFKLSYGNGCSPYVNITDGRGMALPVFGPVSITPPEAVSRFVTTWRVGKTQKDLVLGELIAPPAEATQDVEDRSFSGAFVDMHERFGKEAGAAFFYKDIDAAEDMSLVMRLGYDGPIRVWVDDAPVFTDLAGANPAVPDTGRARLKLTAGRHRFVVGMDVNSGRAWGFMLRFQRQDVTKEQIAQKTFALPTW